MKEIITYSELLSKLKDVVAKSSECKNISVNSFKILHEEQIGTNWSLEYLRCSGDENDVFECRRSIQGEIDSLKEKYNVNPATNGN